MWVFLFSIRVTITLIILLYLIHLLLIVFTIIIMIKSDPLILSGNTQYIVGEWVNKGNVGIKMHSKHFHKTLHLKIWGWEEHRVGSYVPEQLYLFSIAWDPILIKIHIICSYCSKRTCCVLLKLPLLVCGLTSSRGEESLCLFLPVYKWLKNRSSND